jgi:hypothetical protein
MVQRMSRPGGITTAEAMSEFGWTEADVRDVTRLIAVKNGYPVRRDEGGRWTIAQ